MSVVRPTLIGMYDDSVRNVALDALASGSTVSAAARRVGVARSTVRAWRDQPGGANRVVDPVCPRCSEPGAFPPGHYAALLGFYLGDGCLSTFRGKVVLRISCDHALPLIIEDVTSLVATMAPHRTVFHVPAPGTVVVQAGWKHWLCLFPQHGPGRKHERTIVLEPWQQEIVDAHPADFLRGLFHSDGCRTKNWATKVVAGETKRYDYPRWEFSNRSEDIHRLCGGALDALGIPWKRSGRFHLAVSRKEAVAALDAAIGLKG